jgi:hypothetical protein
MASEVIIAIGTLNGIGAMYGPIMPVTQNIGRNANITVKVARLVGLPISFTAAIAPLSRSDALFGVVAEDVLDHHDRVVHQQAERQDQREQRDAVDGLPGGDQPTARVMNRISGMVTVTIEAARQPRKNTSSSHHAGDGDGEVLHQQVDRVVRAGAVVARDVDLHALGDERRADAFQRRQRSSATVTALVPARLAMATVTAGVS